MDFHGGADENNDHYHRLRVAQAESVVGNISLTISANIFIAASTTWLVWNSGGEATIFLWLLAMCFVGLARLIVTRAIVRAKIAQTDPDRALKILTVAAFISGLSWTPVPLFFSWHGDSNVLGFIVFVIAGVTTGAIIQSLAYWRTAVAFGTPLMVATVVMMIVAGGMFNFFLAANIALLTMMLFRASVVSERSFVQSQNVAMRTSQLAQSLAVANGEINRSSQKLEHLANSDVLTGLANRAVFNRRMAFLFDRCRQGKTQIALLLIDLDKFKLVNDTRGHNAGDMLLKTVASRLERVCDHNELAVRLGGDEFAIVLAGTNVEARATAMALDVMKQICIPFKFAGHEIVPAASVGIALAPQHAGDIDELYASADLALYRAKAEGRRRIKFFDAALKDRLDYDRALDRDLASAIEAGSLEVHFQPQIDMITNAATGFEALLRWWHPDIGAVSPPDIVKTAAKLQLSEQLTGYVADRACQFARALDVAGLPGLTVSLNMSPAEFDAYDPAKLLSGVTNRHGVDPKRIEVEITEDAILDPKKVERPIKGLRTAGFAIAVDDFGMGHSSLAHLISLRIDRLKIDRHFVTGISGTPHNQALVAAMVSVGRALDMELVLEGVETSADAETLRALGCRMGQGWLYGKAMPEKDALEWLGRHSGRSRAVA
jgi:diguanylate cyclase (GGDEF)-like protein